MPTPAPLPPPIVASSLERPRITLTVWLADLTYTHQTISAETMPQAIAGLATFAATKMDLVHPVRIFKYPEALAASLEEDGPPDVIGFSHYIWNSHLSLAFAELIKRRFPQTTVVLGGPHYPLHRPEQTVFWHEHLAGKTDFYIAGEGEPAFASLLRTLQDFDRVEVRGHISGVHCLSDDGMFHAPPPRLRIHSLSAVPSPYTAGLMDEFFDGQLVPTVQTNRGCPFKCRLLPGGHPVLPASRQEARTADPRRAALHRPPHETTARSGLGPQRTPHHRQQLRHVPRGPRDLPGARRMPAAVRLAPRRQRNHR
ncbi:cobalamin-dependent protein [Streptomyces sp. MBT53]|nr:cobalamin-dependent protein [Streptomyces sp. MBT53]